MCAVCLSAGIFSQDRNLVTHCLLLRFLLLVGEYAAVVELLPWHKYLHEFVVASDMGCVREKEDSPG